ncbi:MAG: hypothetical protein ABJE10_24440 [bacterium]
MKRKEMSAAAFTAELATDPENVARRQTIEDARVSRSQQISLLLQPVFAELHEAGYETADLNDLVARYAPLPDDAARLLLSWLPRISDLAVKEQIVRSLAATASRFPGTELIKTFEETNSESLRWAIANTMAERTPFGLEQWLAGALSNEHYGKAREMLLIAAARLLDPAEANGLILPFLSSMPLHAAKALAESGGLQERAILENKLGVTKGVERKEIERAIRKIRKRV